MIDLKNIDVVFNSENRVVTAVKDVNIHVNKGEIYGIVGYSWGWKIYFSSDDKLITTPNKR